ncbi:MAG TPA: hypothetical protein VF267_14450 [Gammaproteobacteria bacterium]
MNESATDLLRNAKAILLAGLLLMFLAACGGSGNDNTGGTVDPPPTTPADDDNDDGSGDDDSDSDDDTDDDADDGADDGTDDDDDADDGTDDDGTADDGLAFETFQAASLVIGQQDFSGGQPHQGGTVPSASSLNMPLGGVYSSESDVLFIADSDNARVLGYLGVPDVNNANADFVLGQQDFTSAEKVISAAGMFSPEAVTTNGGRLMITDTDLNRVTVYAGVPESGSAEPVLVVGQTALDVYTGACDQSTLIHPHAHYLAPDGKLLVADAGNNRVLVWNEMPTENGAPADFVLGQVDFNNCSALEPENFQHPAALWSDGERLIVADSEKHRILVWNTFPTESFQAPDVIIGQSDMLHPVPNDDNQDGVSDDAPTARTLSYPRDFSVHEGKLYVADMDNHRVLIWNEIPTESFTPADNVLGQPDFTSNAMNAGEAQPNERGFRRPVGVSVVGDQLLVTEWENSRVMVFDAMTE